MGGAEAATRCRRRGGLIRRVETCNFRRHLAEAAHFARVAVLGQMIGIEPVLGLEVAQRLLVGQGPSGVLP